MAKYDQLGIECLNLNVVKLKASMHENKMPREEENLDLHEKIKTSSATLLMHMHIAIEKVSGLPRHLTICKLME